MGSKLVDVVLELHDPFRFGVLRKLSGSDAFTPHLRAHEEKRPPVRLELDICLGCTRGCHSESFLEVAFPHVTPGSDYVADDVDGDGAAGGGGDSGVDDGHGFR